MTPTALAALEATPAAPPRASAEASLRFAVSAPGAEWDKKAATHADATIFHSTAWARLLQHTYGHRLCYGEFKSADGATSAMVPFAEVRSWITGTRGVTLPFADTCEPLVFHPQPGLFDALCEYARSQKWTYLEVRGKALLPCEATPSTEFAIHTLDLTRGVNEVEKGFDPSTRRALRKSKSGGLTAQVSSSPEALRDYYRLHCSTRRRHGAPPQSLRFFRNLHAFLLGQGRGFVVLARLGREAVAGAVFLHTDRHAVFKFGAMELAFQDLRPSNLVMGTAIRHLAEKGIASLHFGRTSLSNQGLCQFKRGWGAVESKVCYHRYDLRSRHWLAVPDRAGNAGYVARLFRSFPLTANRLIGAIAYPHLD